MPDDVRIKVNTTGVEQTAAGMRKIGDETARANAQLERLAANLSRLSSPLAQIMKGERALHSRV